MRGLDKLKRGLEKLGLTLFLAGAGAVGFGSLPGKAHANPFQNQSVQVDQAPYDKYDWHVIGVRAALTADSLENKVIPDLKASLQNMEDSNPDFQFISSITAPNPPGPMDRIGEQRSILGTSTTPTTSLAWIMDILVVDSSGNVSGVKLRREYRDIAKQIFGENEINELENALSTLLSNTVDVYRVDYEGSDSLNVSSASEPSPFPEWLNSLDGKYAYRLFAIIMAANGYPLEQVAEYAAEYNQTYKQILYISYQLECANKAYSLAKWLDENAKNPDIPNEIKKEKYNQLQRLLEVFAIYL